VRREQAASVSTEGNGYLGVASRGRRVHGNGESFGYAWQVDRCPGIPDPSKDEY